MQPDHFEQTLDEYESQLIGYAYSFLGDVEAARDAVQDTFIRLWNQEETPTAVKAWLYTTCRNRSIDILRKEKRIVNIETEKLEAMADPTPLPDESAEGHDQYAKALGFFRHLSENQKEVIRLRFEGDLSYREISEVTGLSEGNIGFILHTGLKKLREFMNSTSSPALPTDGGSATAAAI